jgi:hypothetical protein
VREAGSISALSKNHPDVESSARFDRELVCMYSLLYKTL